MNGTFMENSISDNKTDNRELASQLCTIDSKGDPVDKTIIRREKYGTGSEGQKGNLFIGYYGIHRVYNDKKIEYKVNGDETKKYLWRVKGKHTGYDYLANEGTEVKAVGNGKIVRVRFGVLGPNPISCPFKLDLFSKEVQDRVPIIQDQLLYPQEINRLNLIPYSNKTESELAEEMANSIIRNRILKQKEDVVNKKDEKLRKIEEEENSILASISKEEEILQNLKKEQNNANIKKKEEVLKKLKNELAIKEHEKIKIKSRFSGSFTCKECPKRASCYGVQVWLKLKDNKYAYYAHLSDLSDDIMSKLSEYITTPDKIGELAPVNNKENSSRMFRNQLEWILGGTTCNTFDFENPLFVRTGEPIGKSGCTGNAYDMKPEAEHLHFECRQSSSNIPENNGCQISPNTIVKTKFYIVKDADENKKNTNEIEVISAGEETIEEITKEKVGVSVKSIDEKKFDWDKNGIIMK
jgi:hypothetical protein